MVASTQMAGKVLGWWFVGNLIFIACWDILSIFAGWNESTVSYFLYLELNKRPLLWFAVGLALGHLLTPLILTAASNGNGHSGK